MCPRIQTFGDAIRRGHFDCGRLYIENRNKQIASSLRKMEHRDAVRVLSKETMLENRFRDLLMDGGPSHIGASILGSRFVSNSEALHYLRDMPFEPAAAIVDGYAMPYNKALSIFNSGRMPIDRVAGIIGKMRNGYKAFALFRDLSPVSRASKVAQSDFMYAGTFQAALINMPDERIVEFLNSFKYERGLQVFHNLEHEIQRKIFLEIRKLKH